MDCLTLKLKALPSFGASRNTRPATRRHIPQNPNFQEHRCKNLRSHREQYVYENALILGLLQDRFTGVSVPSCFSSLLQIIFNIVQPPLFWFSNRPFSSGKFLNTSFEVLSSGTLSRILTNPNIPFVISGIVSGALFTSITSSLVRIRHTPFSFTGPSTSLDVLLSPTHL